MWKRISLTNGTVIEFPQAVASHEAQGLKYCIGTSFLFEDPITMRNYYGDEKHLMLDRMFSFLNAICREASEIHKTNESL